jgi:hypothetical protein
MLGMVALVLLVGGTASANPIIPSCTALTGSTLASFITSVNSTGCYLGDSAGNGIVFSSAAFYDTHPQEPDPVGVTANNPANDHVNVTWNGNTQTGTIDIVPPILFSATAAVPAKSETIQFTMTGNTNQATLNSISGSLNANASGATSIITPTGTTGNAPSTGSFSGGITLVDTGNSDTAALGVKGKTVVSGTVSSPVDNTTYSYQTGGANFSSGNVGHNQVVTLTETYTLQTKTFSSSNNDTVHLSDTSVSIKETLVLPEPLSELLVGGGLVLIGFVSRRRMRRL